MNSTRHNDPCGTLVTSPHLEGRAHGWSARPQEMEAFQPFRGCAIAVRIDAVTQLHDGLLLLIEFALRNKIGLSLEVPPLSSRISGHEIAGLVGSAPGLEIGQHGLAASLPDTGLQDPHQSYSATGFGARFQIDALRRGKLHIEQQFGSFFLGGYSATDDQVPAWIAEAWVELGGQFISFVANRPRGGRLKTVKLSTPFWDFEHNCPRGREAVAGDLRQSIAQLGYAGLVLPAEQLRHIETVNAIQTFFQSLQTAGLRLVHPGAQARFQAETIACSPYRDYRGGVIPNA